MAGVVLTALGFVLLQGQLQNTNGSVLSQIGAAACLFGGVLVVTGEALGLTLGYDKAHGPIAVYVVLAFLAQAAIGGGLLQARSVSAWIGWLGITWNLAGWSFFSYLPDATCISRPCIISCLW